MTTRASDVARRYVPTPTDIGDQPVIASDIIFEGSAVGENGSGFARPLVAGDPFLGFAEVQVDNAAGSAGDKNVRLRTRGTIRLAITGLVAGDLGAAIYASDDDTFTKTQASNTYIGQVVHFESAALGLVAFNAAGPSGSVAALTDSSGGTASGTIAAIGATYDQAEVRDAVASLAAAIEDLAVQTR